MHRLRKPIYLTEEEVNLLSDVLELHLEGLEHVTPIACEDPSLGSWGALLEVAADTTRQIDVLQSLKGRIDELKPAG